MLDTTKIIAMINNHIVEHTVDESTLRLLIDLKKELLGMDDSKIKPSVSSDDKIKLLLRTTGQRCFVDCFSYFRQASKSGIQGFEAEIWKCSGAKKDTSFRTKVSAGTRIFKEGLELDALKVISSANRVDIKTKEKARELLSKEEGQ